MLEHEYPRARGHSRHNSKVPVSESQKADTQSGVSALSSSRCRWQGLANCMKHIDSISSLDTTMVHKLIDELQYLESRKWEVEKQIDNLLNKNKNKPKAKRKK